STPRSTGAHSRRTNAACLAEPRTFRSLPATACHHRQDRKTRRRQNKRQSLGGSTEEACSNLIESSRKHTSGATRTLSCYLASDDLATRQRQSVFLLAPSPAHAPAPGGWGVFSRPL